MERRDIIFLTTQATTSIFSRPQSEMNNQEVSTYSSRPLHLVTHASYNRMPQLPLKYKIRNLDHKHSTKLKRLLSPFFSSGKRRVCVFNSMVQTGGGQCVCDCTYTGKRSFKISLPPLYLSAIIFCSGNSMCFCNSAVHLHKTQASSLPN